MKASFFALALGLAPALHALDLDSHIAAVTVFSDRAVVTRAASVDVDGPGTLEAVFTRLPAGLQEASLHAAGGGTADATLLDVTGRPVYVDHPADERIRSLDSQLKKLEAQQRLIDDDRAELKARRASLAKVESIETQAGDKQPRPTLDDLAKLEEFMAAGRAKIAAALRELDQRSDDLEAKRDALRSQLSALRGGGGNSYKSVAVRFAAARAGRVDLEISYTVFGATWSPSYDARVSDAGHAIALGYFGEVRQSTGEDWTNVALTLSTARPALGGSPPSLPHWTLDLPAPVAAGDLSAVKLSPFEVKDDTRFYFSANTLAGTRINSKRSDFGSEIKIAAAQFDPRVTSAIFRIAVPATVASDNTAQKVPVAAIKLKNEPEYLAIPKEIATAFLASQAVNSSDLPLLAGPMNVFLDDTFVAASRLPTVMPGETFDLALGADEAIALKREEDRHFTETTGLTGHGRRLSYAYTLTVQNNRRTAAKIVVLDQIPVSRNEKITVSLLAPAKDQATTQTDGTVKWTLMLQPEEKRLLPLRFAVEYPGDASIVGLN